MQALFHSAQHIYEKREGSEAVAGSVPLANGFGSGRPKNMPIMWIRNRFRIRIPNTKLKRLLGTAVGDFGDLVDVGHLQPGGEGARASREVVANLINDHISDTLIG